MRIPALRPKSIAALARSLKRDVKDVHADGKKTRVKLRVTAKAA